MSKLRWPEGAVEFRCLVAVVGARNSINQVKSEFSHLRFYEGPRENVVCLASTALEGTAEDGEVLDEANNRLSMACNTLGALEVKFVPIAVEGTVYRLSDEGQVTAIVSAVGTASGTSYAKAEGAASLASGKDTSAPLQEPITMRLHRWAENNDAVAYTSSLLSKRPLSGDDLRRAFETIRSPKCGELNKIIQKAKNSGDKDAQMVKAGLPVSWNEFDNVWQSLNNLHIHSRFHKDHKTEGCPCQAA